MNFNIPNNIDITKKYTTRDGLPVRLYAVDGAGEYQVHGAVRLAERWFFTLWASTTGRSDKLDPRYDLIPAETWRAWTLEEAPKFFMARRNARPELREVIQVRENSCPKVWFDHYTRILEDGSETPCGVEE